MTRIPADTLRGLGVIVAALWLSATRVAVAEDAAYDPSADLRLIARESAPEKDRDAALERVLASAAAITDPDLAARAALSALPSAHPDMAGTLLLRAMEAGEVREEILAAAKAKVLAALKAEEGITSSYAAWAMVLGVRDREEWMTLWPPMAFTAAAISFDAPEIAAALGPDVLQWPGSDEVQKLWKEHVPIAGLFDEAMSDDPATARKGMDALVASTPQAFPFLIATARRGSDGTKPGLVPRRARAITILGIARAKRAVPDLVKFIQDDVEHHENGWVRVASAYALGDIGDASAIAGLSRVLFYLGDVHRLRDLWEYPGAGNTDVPFEGWSDVENYAIDSACCDSLLRLGVRGAAEWLIRERLSPRSGWWRIRVTQDAVDAIRRSFDGAPTSYQPDGGLPDRTKATADYLAWWAKGPTTKTTLDENDPGFRAAAEEIAAHIGQKSVMELQIAKRAAALVGPAMTPTLLDHLAKTTRKVERAELAAVLGTVRDRRAIEPLLGLTRDEVPNVRASAAEALAPLLDSASDPLYSGRSTAGHPEIVARWISMLDDEESGPRSSAMKALTVAPPEAAIRKAIEAHSAATREEGHSGDYVLAEEIALLVQTGEGLDRVAAHLAEPELFRRRYVWELLRAALRIEATEFDPTPDPGSPTAKPVDLALLKAALEKRRAK